MLKSNKKACRQTLTGKAGRLAAEPTRDFRPNRFSRPNST